MEVQELQGDSPSRSTPLLGPATVTSLSDILYLDAAERVQCHDQNVSSSVPPQLTTTETERNRV